MATQGSDRRTKEQFGVRLSPSRLKKLRRVSEVREKSMTSLIEDWIDSLPEPPEDSP